MSVYTNISYKRHILSNLYYYVIFKSVFLVVSIASGGQGEVLLSVLVQPDARITRLDRRLDLHPVELAELDALNLRVLGAGASRRPHGRSRVPCAISEYFRVAV